MESSSGPIIPWTVFGRNRVWKFYSSGILWCVNLLSGCITSDSFETLASTLRFTKGQLHHQMSFQLTGSLKNYRTRSPEANSLMDFIFKTTPLMCGSQNTQFCTVIPDATRFAMPFLTLNAPLRHVHTWLLCLFLDGSLPLNLFVS